MRRIWIKFALALSLLGGAGCSDTEQSAISEIGAIAATQLRGPDQDPSLLSPPDPQELRDFTEPLLLVRNEKTGQYAIVGLASTIGAVKTWLAIDRATISLRNGVVVATRGMGNDLMSAQVPDISVERGEVVRDLFYLGGNERPLRHRYFCTIVDRGNAKAALIDRSYPARYIVESCAPADPALGVAHVNEYWRGGDQHFWKSRQFVGPEIGYITIFDVQDGTSKHQ